MILCEIECRRWLALRWAGFYASSKAGAVLPLRVSCIVYWISRNTRLREKVKSSDVGENSLCLPPTQRFRFDWKNNSVALSLGS